MTRFFILKIHYFVKTTVIKTIVKPVKTTYLRFSANNVYVIEQIN